MSLLDDLKYALREIETDDQAAGACALFLVEYTAANPSNKAGQLLISVKQKSTEKDYTVAVAPGKLVLEKTVKKGGENG